MGIFPIAYTEKNAKPLPSTVPQILISLNIKKNNSYIRLIKDAEYGGMSVVSAHVRQMTFLTISGGNITKS